MAGNATACSSIKHAATTNPEVLSTIDSSETSEQVAASVMQTEGSNSDEEGSDGKKSDGEESEEYDEEMQKIMARCFETKKQAIEAWRLQTGIPAQPGDQVQMSEEL